MSTPPVRVLPKLNGSTIEINYVAALNDLLRRHPSGNLAPRLTWVMEQHPDEQGPHVAILKFCGDTVSKGEDASKIRAIQAAARTALAYFREHGVPASEVAQTPPSIPYPLTQT